MFLSSTLYLEDLPPDTLKEAVVGCQITYALKFIQIFFLHLEHFICSTNLLENSCF